MERRGFFATIAAGLVAALLPHRAAPKAEHVDGTWVPLRAAMEAWRGPHAIYIQAGDEPVYYSMPGIRPTRIQCHFSREVDVRFDFKEGGSR